MGGGRRGGCGWEEGKKGGELGREENGLLSRTGVCKFLIGCAVMSNLFTFIK